MAGLFNKIKTPKAIANKTEQVQVLVSKGSNLVKLNIAIVKYLLATIFLAIMALSGVVYVLVEFQNLPDAYAFNKTAVTPLVTQSLPRLSNEAVLRWSSQAISDIFTFNFADDIDAHLQRVSHYFTEEGFAQYNDNLKSSGLLQDLVAKQLVYRANSCDIVSILNQNTVTINNNPITVWDMEIPMILQLQSNSPTKLNRYIISLTIEGGAGVKPDQSIGIAGIKMGFAEYGVCGVKL